MTLADTAEVAPVDLLVAGATLVATVDDERREIPGGWVSVRDGPDRGGRGAGPRAAPPRAGSTRPAAWSRPAW